MKETVRSLSQGEYEGRRFRVQAELSPVTEFDEDGHTLGGLRASTCYFCMECGQSFSEWEDLKSHREPDSLRADKPLIGYRVWTSYPQDWTSYPGVRGRDDPTEKLGLYSLINYHRWNRPRQPLKAVCPMYAAEHPSPTFGCGCGIYSYSTYEAAKLHLFDLQQYVNSYYVVGAVRIWGKVLAGKVKYPATQDENYRYRSEFAQVIGLEVGEINLTGALAEKYGLPLYTAKELQLLSQLPDAGSVE